MLWRSKTRDVVDTLGPYADQIAKDKKLRRHAVEAVRSGEKARRRLFPAGGVVAAAARLAQDEQLRGKIMDAVEELREAQERLRPRKSHRLRKLVLVLGGVGAAFLNPYTGMQTRQRLSKVLGRARGSSGEGQGSGEGAGPTTTEIEESIEVDAPVATAYNQWTQFEEFPRFMEGVESVRQLDETRLHWAAQVAGRREEWDAQITDQRPDQHIAWRSTSGKTNSGAVTFEPQGGDRTRITIRMSYEQEGLAETLGAAVGADRRRVKGDLNRFKELIESRGSETGAWRGQVEEGRVQSSS